MWSVELSQAAEEYLNTLREPELSSVLAAIGRLTLGPNSAGFARSYRPKNRPDLWVTPVGSRFLLAYQIQEERRILVADLVVSSLSEIEPAAVA